MTATFGEGRSFFYVLNKNTYDNRYHGKNHDKNLIVSQIGLSVIPDGFLMGQFKCMGIVIM